MVVSFHHTMPQRLETFQALSVVALDESLVGFLKLLAAVVTAQTLSLPLTEFVLENLGFDLAQPRLSLGVVPGDLGDVGNLNAGVDVRAE